MLFAVCAPIRRHFIARARAVLSPKTQLKFAFSLLTLLFAGIYSSIALAQPAAEPETTPPGNSDGAAQTTTRPRLAAPTGYRRLVPGIETTIPAQFDPSETFSYHNMTEVLAIPNIDWTPQTVAKTRTLKDRATGTAFRRDVWNLELTFKPIRMIAVDMPAVGGKMQRTMVWYMIYRVKNNGGHLHPEPKPQESGDTLYEIKRVNEMPVTFSPQFTLFSPELQKSSLDQIIPVAMEPIRLREDPKRTFLNSIEMAAKPIPLSTPTQDNSVWGVAMWEVGLDHGGQVDPRTDYFSIFVSGLSNAYKFVDPPGAYKYGDTPGTGRLYRQKMLQLNFWRPSDVLDEAEQEVYFGVPPELGIRGQIDYQWLFR